jgi:hypothetical protein
MVFIVQVSPTMTIIVYYTLYYSFYYTIYIYIYYTIYIYIYILYYIILSIIVYYTLFSGACTSGAHEKCFTLAGSGLIHKHYTRLETFAGNKHCSLLGTFVSICCEYGPIYAMDCLYWRHLLAKLSVTATR